MTRFVIDELEVVHVSFCSDVNGSGTEYRSVAKTTEEMIEHLMRPDVKDRRSAPSPLVACDFCLLGKTIDEDGLVS